MIRSLSIKHTVPTKTVEISTPQNKKLYESKLKGNIILVCKFTFNAEAGSELSIKKGDIVKLLHRQGNGWLLVKFIDRMNEPGLVPAKYMDIMMNDVKNPVTLNWLHNTDGSFDNLEFLESNYLDVQVINLLKTTPPLTINNSPYPLAANVSRLFLFNDRYWYCVEVLLSDHTTAYLCRYYENFYNLHSLLLDRMNNLELSAENRNSLKLPKLPEPIPRSLEDMTTSIIKRCDDLNEYLNNLVKNEKYACSRILLSWVDIQYNNLPGLIVKTNDLNFSNDDLIHQLLPGSVDIIRQQKDRQNKARSDKAADTERNQGNKKLNSKSNGSLKRKNTYNNYQQATKFTYQGNLPSTPHASPNTFKINNAGQP